MNRPLWSCALSLSICAAVALPASAVTYSGSLSGADGGMTVSSEWTGQEAAASFSYEVWQDGSNWVYDYRFSVPGGADSPDLSHLILDDMIDAPGQEDSAGVAGEAYGLELEEMGELKVWHVQFSLPRAPMVGDFYGRGGNAFAYSTGLSGSPRAPEVPDMAEVIGEDQALAGHVPVPGPEITQVVPEPLTMFGLLFATAGAGGYLRRRVTRTG